MSDESKYAGHTKGPWFTSLGEKYVRHDGVHGPNICDFESFGGPPSEQAANARLIADAPMLLEERDNLQVALDAVRVTMEAHRKEQKKAMEERDALLAAAKRAKKLLEPEVVKEPDRTIFWELVAAIALVDREK